MRGSRGLVKALVVVIGLTASGCLEKTGVTVAALSFEGVEAVDEKILRSALVTQRSGRFPWSTKSPFDREVFEADLVRIRQFYQDRGFPDARIASVDISLNDRADAARLTVVVDEGAPVTVAGVQVTGTEGLPPDLARQLQSPPIEVGRPRSRIEVAEARQRINTLLHDNGRAYGEVAVSEAPAPRASSSVTLRFAVDAGPETVFGPVTFTGLAHLDASVLRRQLSFRPGVPYSTRLVTESQRRLGQLELLRFVNIDARPPAGTGASVVPVTVTVTESPARRLQFGLGYGTEEQVRASVEWSHLNAFGRANRFTSEAKWSWLERGARAGLTQPYFLKRGLSLDLTASTWWTEEWSYRSHTRGGRAGVSYRLPGRSRGSERRAGDVVRAAYVHEYLNYSIPEDVLADSSNFATLIALGLNPVTGQGRGTKAAVSLSYERTAIDGALDPRRGYGVSATLDYARPWLGGTFRYTEYSGDMRGYVPLGPRLVIGGRARMAQLVAVRDDDVPFSERYFLGGSSSLRGWGRYQVAPLSDGVPIGGRTSFDVTVEARLSVRGPVGVVGFVDMGNVWAGNPAVDFDALRRDVGVGLRYASRVGLVRGDIGVQLNPIDGLLVDGAPESRRWRVHFSIGQSF